MLWLGDVKVARWERAPSKRLIMGFKRAAPPPPPRRLVLRLAHGLHGPRLAAAGDAHRRRQELPDVGHRRDGRSRRDKVPVAAGVRRTRRCCTCCGRPPSCRPGVGEAPRGGVDAAAGAAGDHHPHVPRAEGGGDGSTASSCKSEEQLLYSILEELPDLLEIVPNLDEIFPITPDELAETSSASPGPGRRASTTCGCASSR